MTNEINYMFKKKKKLQINYKLLLYMATTRRTYKFDYIN